MPLPPVATGTAGATIPPPPVTANVTKTPCIGLPTASVTLTDGGVGTLVPAAAFWPSPATFVSLAGAAVRADALNVTLRLAGALFPTAAAVTVCAPAAGPSVQFVPAWPSAPVVADAGE